MKNNWVNFLITYGSLQNDNLKWEWAEQTVENEHRVVGELWFENRNRYELIMHLVMVRER